MPYQPPVTMRPQPRPSPPTTPTRVPARPQPRLQPQPERLAAPITPAPTVEPARPREVEFAPPEQLGVVLDVVVPRPDDLGIELK